MTNRHIETRARNRTTNRHTLTRCPTCKQLRPSPHTCDQVWHLEPFEAALLSVAAVGVLIVAAIIVL